MMEKNPVIRHESAHQGAVKHRAPAVVLGLQAGTMEERMRDGPKSPKVLTEADFVESMGYLIPRPPEPGTCLLIVAHTNLYGTEPAEDEFDRSDARDFLKMALSVAQEFREIRVGLLNQNDAPAAIRRLPISVDWSHAEASICLPCGEWRQVICDGETPESLRLWLRGILLAIGLRSTITRDDLDVRLAYELAQPATWSFTDARWDEPDFRSKLYKAAKEELDRLTEEWTGRFP
jgi:hypothetical protein